jgi:hypothetical protein
MPALDLGLDLAPQSLDSNPLLGIPSCPEFEQNPAG